ncbi:MAG TPA: family 78 glycoside hydrolase catalytic domain [Ohtaekwangia sp.]|nr:family 78 glycoside hydrolase catalytic domain [Ohtaekwangia sp.]
MIKGVLRLLVFVFFSVHAVEAQVSPLSIGKLTVEYRENPLGIDEQNPAFSWTLVSGARSQFQSAFEIIVSDNAADIARLKGNVWQPGKLLSGENIQRRYDGAPLKPFTRYYWRVKVYDQRGLPSSWSPAAWFETAMLDTPWKSKWISDGSVDPARDEDHYKPDPMPLFRKAFTPRKSIASARLYISGVGYYEAYLNGKKISDNVLDPGWTTYRQQVLYVVHDITPMLRKGGNVAGIMLGNGWWHPLPMKIFGRIDLRDFQETGRPCVKAEMHLHYSDGSTEIIGTDETWQTAPGPVIRNNVYLGEHYDARLEVADWNSSKAPRGDWKNAVVTNGPSGLLTVQMQPPVTVQKIVKPIRITQPRPDTFIVDMGENFAGVARIKVKGPAGRKITLRYGEDIHKNGTLNFLTAVATQIKKGGIRGGPGAPETAWQEDSYTLKGTGVESWSPKFTFHAMRYVEVTGWPGSPTVSDIEGVALSAALEQDGEFSCSNGMFNQLDGVIRRTFLSNVFSVQSDCPGREKMGYGADMVVTAEAFMYNFNMSNFYRKAVRDFANEQQPDGGITEMAPYMGIADRGYGGESGPLGWTLAFPFLQQKLYEFYGDKRIIETHYDAFAKQMDFLRAKAVGGLFHWDIGDHEALDPRAEAFSAASFYYHHARLASSFAGILDKRDDSVKYQRLADNIKRLIVRKYLVPGTGRFDNATQSAQVFALWYDLSPEEEATFKVLTDEFERHRWHVSSGIYGVKMMFDVLREKNKNDLAYRIANQRDFPGWGYMLENGATTLWESWEYPENFPSQNHPMFGSISEWFYRSLLGINPAAPGFSKVIIKPQPAGDLTWAKGSYHTVRGKISSDWKIQDKEFVFKVSIPGNTTAVIYIPSKDGVITEDGKPVSTDHHEQGYAIVEVGSGNYTFKSGI